MSFSQHIFQVVDWMFLTFSVSIATSYLVLAIISFVAIKNYMKRRSLSDFHALIGSNLAPSVSLIAPAYNEGPTIIENIRSMLSLEYNNYNVIVVNDGSKDDTLQKVIKAFDLVKVPFFIQKNLSSKRVFGVYKSTNKAYKKLVFVDKENGGKSDALNAGINVSNSRFVACIDVDCILENDSLQRMVKPFMEDSSVIASGGVVRVANSCEVKHGRLIKVKLSSNRLARFQVIEYMRAFLLGRMAWSKLNGLLLISGAFGMFDRKLIVEAGGYSTNTVGEDMELVVRLRSLMTRKKRNFKVHMIPDPLCWTEVPADNKTLGKQRNRWARGTIDTLIRHSNMLFNPKHGIGGVLSFPFWMMFEWFAPILEIIGLVYFMVQIALGNIEWIHFGMLLFMFYNFAFLFSCFSLYAEEISFNKYYRIKDLFKLLGTALLEPISYHPRVTFWSVKGNIDHLKGVKAWGEMKREGFKESSELSYNMP